MACNELFRASFIYKCIANLCKTKADPERNLSQTRNISALQYNKSNAKIKNGSESKIKLKTEI